MPKREAVPAALHAELTEYASLIRALRTSNTLDVTHHITKPTVRSRDTSEDLNSDDDVSEEEEFDLEGGPSEGNVSEIPDNPPSTPQSRYTSPVTPGTPSPSESRKRKRKAEPPSRPGKRDSWTRWPLLAGDVTIPEWSLEDEIEVLAEKALKNQKHSHLVRPETSSRSNDSDLDDDDDDDFDDPSKYLPHLTNVITNYLSAILAHLVEHTPNRPASQQNRIEPIGWRTVLDILSVSIDPRLSNPMIIMNVQRRMQALYGTRETESAGELLAHRMQSSSAAKARLRSLMAEPMESLLKLASRPDTDSS